MDIYTALVCIAGILAVVYVLRLAMMLFAHLEAGGSYGNGYFFIKARERKK